MILFLAFGFAMVVLATPADSVDVSLLKYADYREQVIRKPLLERALADSTLSVGMRTLTQASLYFQNEKYDSALVLYRAHQKDIPDIEGHVLMRMARCALELGLGDSARAILLSTTSQVKNRPWWEQADRILSESILRDSNFTVAQRLDSVVVRIKAKPGDAYLAWLRLKQGMLLQEQGNLLEAQNSYVAALGNSDYRGSALDALMELKPKIGYPKSTWALSETILKLCKSGQNQECVDWADSLFMRPDLSGGVRNSLLAAQATALQGQEKLDSAAVRFKWLLDSVELRPGWMQSLMRIHRKLKRTKEADRLDSLFRKEFPYSPENANNLWVSALELEQEGRYVESFLEYSELMDPRFGRNQRRQWAPFKMGLLWYKQEMYQEALHVLVAPTKNAEFLWPQAAAMFFRAECFLKLKQDSAARSEYLTTIRTFPLSWYGHRARVRLVENKLLDSSQVPWVKVFEASQAKTLEWIRRKISRNKRLEDAGTDRIHMIELLLQTGFEKEGRVVLSKSINAFGRRPDFLFEAGQMLMRNGEPGESFRMARDFLEVANRQWFNDMPRPVAELMYPMPSPWIEPARAFVKPPVDPFLLFGVMRQESIFVPDISSPVGARGLMQIMPQTGSTLAKAEGIKGYNVDLLYNPVMAIRLGSRYLNDLLLEYGGDPVYTLANYNAGPKPAKRWQEGNKGKLLDLAVEDISYWETREYVKKVMGNYWTYQAIYGKESRE
jgi:soluble lytic murein transglycosylase